MICADSKVYKKPFGEERNLAKMRKNASEDQKDLSNQLGSVEKDLQPPKETKNHPIRQTGQ